jgi:hypothetical protein
VCAEGEHGERDEGLVAVEADAMWVSNRILVLVDSTRP